MFHVKRLRLVSRAVVWAIGSLACDAPSDIIVEPPQFTPVEVEPGVFRVTFGAGPAVARGFLPDGRLLFRAFDLPPFGRDWVLVSVPPTGGHLREEVALYRTALVDDVGHLAADSTHRLLVLWKAPIPGLDGCPDSSLTDQGTPGPAPHTPSPIGFTVLALPEADGVPVDAIPSRSVSTGLVEGTGTRQQRVRVHPVARDVDRTAVNAFGPVLMSGGTEMVYSDGEQLWRTATSDTSAVPQSLGLGAYPALSPDGRILAYARPSGLDTTVLTYTIPLGFGVCVEEYAAIWESGWEVVTRDLDAGTEQVLAPGLDPAFDPLGGRIVVRTGQLQWVDLATGVASAIPGTTGGFGPSVSPDGELLAFSRMNGPSNSDVYFVRIPR